MDGVRADRVVGRWYKCSQCNSENSQTYILHTSTPAAKRCGWCGRFWKLIEEKQFEDSQTKAR